MRASYVRNLIGYENDIHALYVYSGAEIIKNTGRQDLLLSNPLQPCLLE